MTEYRDPRKTFGLALLDAANEDTNILALSADSSSGSGLTPFAEAHPERHLEFGIMEQGVIGYASGLATTGKIPFVVAIAPFVTARPFEMVRNDLGYMRQNVKVVGRCAGMSYSDLGGTHQSLDDIALTRTIPGMTVVNPGDPIEIVQAVKAVAKHVGPVYMKIGRQPMPILYGEDYVFELGKAVQMRDGDDVTLVGTGTVLSKAVDAADLLRERGIHARTLNIHTIKPLDKEAVLKAAHETGGIVVVEEHYCAGGLGGAIAELLAVECPTPMCFIGVDDQFASNGPYEELLGLYGLQAEQVAAAIQSFIESRVSR